MATDPRSKASVTLMEGGGAIPGQSFELGRDVMTLGRASDCDIILDSDLVSKRHARIIREPTGFSLEDLGSKNGTLLGGVPLSQSVLLRQGDTFKIGKHVFVFRGPIEVRERSEADPIILGVLDTLGESDPYPSGARPEEKLRAIVEISHDLVLVPDPAAVPDQAPEAALEKIFDTAVDKALNAALDKALGGLFRIFPQAHRGFVLLGERGDVDLVPRAFKARDRVPGNQSISRTIFDRVVAGGEAILCEDVAVDGRFAPSPSIRDAHIRTLMCVPLRSHGRPPAGILQIDTIDHEARFDQDDLDILAAVAAQIGVVVENARLLKVARRQWKLEKECLDARNVQRVLIPREGPSLAGYEFWGAYEPARYVGGDYFDYIPIARHGTTPIRWAVALGDVAGKGIPAALLMARLSGQVRLLLESEPDPARVVGRLNDILCAAGTEEMFITFLLALVDGEGHKLTVVNAGHPRPMVRRKDGQIETIGEEEAGPFLSAFEGRAYRSATVSIGPGDLVVLYTDGVIEAMDAENRCFLVEKLERAFAAAPDRPASAGKAILEAIRRHAAGREQYDDITLLCFGRT